MLDKALIRKQKMDALNLNTAVSAVLAGAVLLVIWQIFGGIGGGGTSPKVATKEVPVSAPKPKKKSKKIRKKEEKSNSFNLELMEMSKKGSVVTKNTGSSEFLAIFITIHVQLKACFYLLTMAKFRQSAFRYCFWVAERGGGNIKRLSIKHWSRH